MKIASVRLLVLKSALDMFPWRKSCGKGRKTSDPLGSTNTQILQNSLLLNSERRMGNELDNIFSLKKIIKVGREEVSSSWVNEHPDFAAFPSAEFCGIQPAELHL